METNTICDVAELVLGESAEPMHVSTILALIKQRQLYAFETPDELGILARKIREKTSANPTCRDLRFIKTAPNTFGLLSWYAEEANGEDAFQDAVSELAAQCTPTILPDAPVPIPSSSASVVHRRGRDPRVAATAIASAGFKCEANCDSRLFRSFATGQFYVEAHHLVPLAAQVHFPFSLDVVANIVALCPSCHKAVHHAVQDEIVIILDALLNARRVRLEASGILLSASLVSMY